VRFSLADMTAEWFLDKAKRRHQKLLGDPIWFAFSKEDAFLSGAMLGAAVTMLTLALFFAAFGLRMVRGG